MSKGLTRELQALKKQMREVAAASALQAAQEALRLSQDRVPVVTGKLKSGGKAQSINSSSKGALASTFYIAPYAANVHENPMGRGFKWLETSAAEVDFAAILKKNWEESQ